MDFGAPRVEEKSFRVVLFATAGARLQEKAQDPPAAWSIDLTLDSTPVDVFIRDIAEMVDGVPIHAGIESQVTTTAPDIDEAIRLARGVAGLYCSAVSLASRSWVGAPEPQIAYEVTAGVTDRAHRQWYRDAPVPIGKTPVPTDLFGAIHQGMLGLADCDPHTFLIRMAGEFYTGALREIEPILRFMLLWPAAEALDEPLRRQMTQVRGDQRHWGLKAFTRQQGDDPQLIDDAYDLRTDLVHVKPGRIGSDLIRDANEFGRRLEPLVARALCLVLGASSVHGALPSLVTTAHPVDLILDAVIEGDPAIWGRVSHPNVTVDYSLSAESAVNGVQVSVTPTFTLQNCDRLRSPSLSVWGPHGPNAGTMEFSSAKVIRDGVEEVVSPID